MRALFDYNPKEDTLLPCKEIGLEFKRGDILQVSIANLQTVTTHIRNYISKICHNDIGIR